MAADGFSWRAVRVISTAVSSRPTATTSRAARSISARISTSRRVASPPTPARPAEFASAIICGEMSTTTMESAGTPASCSVRTALRPFVPYPTTTV